MKDTGKDQNQPFPVVIGNDDSVSKVMSGNNSCSESYEQGKVEQLQQESNLDSLQAFDKVNEPILKPLPECTAQLGSDFGAMSFTPLQTYTGSPTHNSHILSILSDPLLLHRRVRESCLPNYMGIRAPVATNLNIANWRHFLVDYWYVSWWICWNSGFLWILTDLWI